MNTEYKTENYKAMKGLMYLLIVSVVYVALLIIVGVWLKTPMLGPFGFACLIILPYCFAKKIKALFTKRILLEFDDVSFSITQYHSKNDTVSKQLHISWNEIKSYKVFFTPAKNTIITIYLRNGEIKRWNFKDNKTSEEAFKSESLFKTFYTYIKQYNKDKNNDTKIALNRGFFNSKIGTTVIYFEIALVVFGFVFHVIMHPQSSILTLFIGFSLTIQQYFKRKQEKELYNKISSLE